MSDPEIEEMELSVEAAVSKQCKNFLSSSTKRNEKNQHRQQKYRVEWEEDVRFKCWLSKMTNGNAYCNACRSMIQPRHASLIQHAKSNKHESSMKSYSPASSIRNFFKTPVDDEVKKAELKVCAALVEHNIPFKFMDHMSEVIASAFHDSAIAKKFSCKRTKARALTYNVLSAQMKEDMLADMKRGNDKQKTKFSIIIDESTDISITNNLAIVVKFHSELGKCIKTKLLNLIEVHDKSANGLFDMLCKEVHQHGLEIGNVIGFAADTTNVMFGEHNSIAQKLREVSSDCVFMKCVCHSTALAVSKACAVLPRGVEDLIRDTYSYFSYSSKRRDDFKNFQQFTDSPEHKILKLYDVRWLSLSACVERVLELWDALLLYFADQRLNERLLVADRLHEMYNNPYYKMYCYFLSHVLSVTNKFNIIFQAPYPVIMHLYKTMCESYKTICSLYLKSGYVRATEAKNIEPNSSVNFLPLSEIYLGVKAASFLHGNKSLRDDKKKMLDFLTACRSFLIILCKEIRMRLPFEDELLPMLSFLDPTTALSGSIPSLLPVMLKFPHIFDEEFAIVVDNEWRALHLCEMASFDNE